MTDLVTALLGFAFCIGMLIGIGVSMALDRAELEAYRHIARQTKEPNF